jgi:hypothetical protein
VLHQALPFIAAQGLLAVNGDTFLEIPLAEMARQAADPQVDGGLVARPDGSGRYGRRRTRADVRRGGAVQEKGAGAH